MSKKRCYDVTGKAPIGVRWVDINKQDDASPLHRSRLVAKDFNKGKDPDLYTATPPLELLRVLVSLAASRKGKGGGRWKLMVGDVSRAYVYAPSLKPTFVGICPEDFEPGDEHRCGELNVSMYRTRPAAGNWQRFYTQTLVESGFLRASSSTCIFFHPAKHVLVFVHGDDFVSVGDGDDLQWFSLVLGRSFEIKSTMSATRNKSRSSTASSR